MVLPFQTNIATPPDFPGLPSIMFCLSSDGCVPSSSPTRSEGNAFPTLNFLRESPMFLNEKNVIIGGIQHSKSFCDPETLSVVILVPLSNSSVPLLGTVVPSLALCLKACLALN
eukprot:489926-Heterocapsa_arctica.AAC.1